MPLGTRVSARGGGCGTSARLRTRWDQGLGASVVRNGCSQPRTVNTRAVANSLFTNCSAGLSRWVEVRAPKPSTHVQAARNSAQAPPQSPRLDRSQSPSNRRAYARLQGADAAPAGFEPRKVLWWWLSLESVGALPWSIDSSGRNEKRERCSAVTRCCRPAMTT